MVHSKGCLVVFGITLAVGHGDVQLMSGEHTDLNRCVVFGHTRKQPEHRATVALLSGETYDPANPNGGYFSEYGSRPQGFPLLRIESAVGGWPAASAATCKQRDGVLVMPVAKHFTNLFHLLHNAAGTFDLVHRVKLHLATGGGGSAQAQMWLLPWIQGGGGYTEAALTTTATFNFFVVGPFLEATGGVNFTGLAGGIDQGIQRWAADAETMVSGCTCFDEVFYGNQRFRLTSRSTMKLQHSYVSALREHVKRAYPATAAIDSDTPGAQGGAIIFSLRPSDFGRAIDNEAALRSHPAFRSGARNTSARIRGMPVEFHYFHTLSLADQFSIVQRARILVGVHGQGLAWTALLPVATGRPCALVEIYGASWAPPRDYEEWSMANEVDYTKLKQADGARCAAGNFCKDFRSRVRDGGGDVTIDFDQLVAHLTSVADRLGMGDSAALGAPAAAHTDTPPL